MEDNISNYLTYTDTVLYWGPCDNFFERLENVCSELNVELYPADCVTDIVALPSFLSIINPLISTSDELASLSEFITEMNVPDFKILLTSDYEEAKFPSRNLIRKPAKLDDDFLKFLILRTRSKIRGMKAKWERTERRLVRLMHMVRLFDIGIPFSVAEIAKEFQVTKRTIQRDIGILEMAYYPIVRDNENKYSTPHTFKMYEFHYHGELPPENVGD